MFWCEGRDLSDPGLMDSLKNRLLDSYSPKQKPSHKNNRIARDWESAWHETGRAGVPLIVSPDERLLIGCVPTDHIRRFFS